MKRNGPLTRRDFLNQSVSAASGLVVGSSGLLSAGSALLAPSQANAVAPPMWVPGTSISYVQTNKMSYSYSGTAGNMTFTFGSNVAVGNTVIVSFHSRNAGVLMGTVSGLGNSNWTALASFAGYSTTTFTAVLTTVCTVAGNTVTIALSGGNDAIAVFGTEFSGMANVSDSVQTGTASTGTVLSPSTPAFAKYQPEVLYSAGTMNSTASISAGPTNSFTSLGLVNLAYPTVSSKLTATAAYRIVQASSDYTTSWTYSANNIWGMVLVAVK